MKSNKKILAIFIAIPLLVGVLSAFLTMNSMEVFANVDKPPFSPPAWLFPVVWTILYTLMGVSSYLVWNSTSDKEEIAGALRIYAYQLIVNFLWPTFFFNLEWYLFSFFWLILLWILVLTMILKFKEISKIAAYLNIPYLIWLTIAAYLNLTIWMLNR